MRKSHIGEFEELVLLAVAALDGKGYGLTVRDLVFDQTGRMVSLGAVHATLYRLQDKGFLDSGMSGATEKRGGRRKRMFSLTNAGIETIRSARTAREQIWNLIPKRLRTETTP